MYKRQKQAIAKDLKNATLISVAEQVGRSPSSVSRLFLEATGMTFTDYLTGQRMEKANQLLGQPYAIHGEVVHGNHIGGRLLGFTTANILPPPIKRLPRYGVYVSRVLVDGVYYKGVTNIGKKPTVGGEYPAGVETYIFGLEGDIYGKNIEVQILAFDRPEQKFTSLEELKERIEKDKEFANAYYETVSYTHLTLPTICSV